MNSATVISTKPEPFEKSFYIPTFLRSTHGFSEFIHFIQDYNFGTCRWSLLLCISLVMLHLPVYAEDASPDASPAADNLECGQEGATDDCGAADVGEIPGKEIFIQEISKVARGLIRSF